MIKRKIHSPIIIKKKLISKKTTKYSMPFIEELEYKYLLKYWHFLKFAEDDIIRGLNSKYDIFTDWNGKFGSGISEIAVGTERVIYALLNGKIAGQPNSSPVSSDLFFETEDAFIHIDLKSVITSDGTIKNKKGQTTDNITDFNTSIFVGTNQNSYRGYATYKKGPNKGTKREYVPNLPTYYTKKDGTKKPTLTFFVTILSNSITMETELISIMCMPNGILEPHYQERPLKFGKNPDKTRYDFSKAYKFELLHDTPNRIKIIYKNPKMSDWVMKKLSFYLNIIKE